MSEVIDGLLSRASQALLEFDRIVPLDQSAGLQQRGLKTSGKRTNRLPCSEGQKIFPAGSRAWEPLSQSRSSPFCVCGVGKVAFGI
jgi:hypothetical protein